MDFLTFALLTIELVCFWERGAVEYMANALVNKLIHPPTTALKEDAEDKDVLIATIKRLYDLRKRGE